MKEGALLAGCIVSDERYSVIFIFVLSSFGRKMVFFSVFKVSFYYRISLLFNYEMLWDSLSFFNLWVYCFIKLKTFLLLFSQFFYSILSSIPWCSNHTGILAPEVVPQVTKSWPVFLYYFIFLSFILDSCCCYVFRITVFSSTLSNLSIQYNFHFRLVVFVFRISVVLFILYLSCLQETPTYEIHLQ